MTRNAKISSVLVAVAAVVVSALVLLSGGDDDPSAAESEERSRNSAPRSGDVAASTVEADDERLVRPESPRLSDGPDATFVEFLDFACEACGALFPIVEDLRGTYGDQITFVVRYLPLHPASMDAARAAEAARAQGRFEDMYRKLFETQAEWGESEGPERDRFFGYADSLGLDMAEFERVFDDAGSQAIIEQSQADATSLGVKGTPSLFLDGERLEPRTVDDLVAAFDAAVRS